MPIQRAAFLLLILTPLARGQTSQPKLDAFNYIVGTQTIGPAYHFTDDPPLVETARAILAMGSNTLKISLARKQGNRYLGHRNIHENTKTLTQLVREEPAYDQVLKMPFAHILFWAHTFAAPNWKDGLSDSERKAEYAEIHDLAVYLLQTFSNSGKTFYLGHWEGDWLLRGAGRPDAIAEPGAIAGMIDWLNIRQQAIDDAKRQVPHHDVRIYHYTEVNLVRIGMEGKPCVTTDVLPRTRVDFVSYSAYDTQNDPQRLKQALSFIEQHLPPTSNPTINARRVFIGEYGFPAYRFSPVKQSRFSRRVMRAGLEWGCPFVLYWEMYNNEIDPQGRQRGFWMIDDHNQKQPIYLAHQRFYARAREWVREFTTVHGRVPAPDEFSRQAVHWLGFPPSATTAANTAATTPARPAASTRPSPARSPAAP